MRPVPLAAIAPASDGACETLRTSKHRKDELKGAVVAEGAVLSLKRLISHGRPGQSACSTMIAPQHVPLPALRCHL